MNKALASIAGVMSAALILSVPVSATAEKGQVEGGDIYWAKNIASGGFVDPANATCGDTVQFRVRLHNPGPSPLTNVNVKATLSSAVATSHSSTVTTTSESAQPSTTTDTAGVTLDKAGKLVYIAGSTELLDANASKMSTLGETIFTTGVNVETVGVSTQQKRFVQFQVKVECPTTPTTPVTPTTPKTPEAPKALGTQAPAVIPSTGPASTALSMLGLGSLAAAATYYVRSRRANILG